MAYSQLQKLEANVSIKASAEQFYDVLCHKTHQIPKIFPEKALSVEILKGAWGTEGSIISWNYLYGMGIIFSSKFYQQTLRFHLVSLY